MAAPGPARAQPHLEGSWSFQVRFPPGSMLSEAAGTLELRSTRCSGEDRCDFQGTARVGSSSWTIESGLYEGGTVSFRSVDPSLDVVYRFSGRMSPDGGSIHQGTLEYDSRLGRRTGGSWSARRLGGAAARTDSDAEDDLVAALGPEVRTVLEDLARRGLLESEDAIDLVSERARDPRVRAAGGRLSEALRGRPLAVLTDTERTAVTTLAGMALLASVMDRNGEPAFPAAAANLGVLTELGVRAATDPDPARAHQAATGMARYAAMLRDLDVKALEDRHGAGSGETRS